MLQRQPSLSPRLLFALIMGGMVVWALYIAVGVYLSTFNFMRAAVVLVCMAMFLGFWLLFLWNSGRSKRP